MKIYGKDTIYHTNIGELRVAVRLYKDDELVVNIERLRSGERVHQIASKTATRQELEAMAEAWIIAH